MARKDGPLASGIRAEHDYHRKFDVALLAPFESGENFEERRELFDAIGKSVEGLRKRVFVPHRDVDMRWKDSKTYDIVCGLVIPGCDVGVCYLGIASSAVGVMIGTALGRGVPLIYACDRNREPKIESSMMRVPGNKLVLFDGEREGAEKVRAAVESFYRQ